MFSDLHVLILNGGRDTFYYFFTKPSKTLGKTRSPIHVYLRFPRACTGKNPFRAHESSAGSGGTSETEVIGERKDLYILLNPPARRRAQLAHPPIVVEEMLTSSEESYCRWTPSASRPKSMFSFAHVNAVSQCVVHAACCSLLSSRACLLCIASASLVCCWFNFALQLFFYVLFTSRSLKLCAWPSKAFRK